MKSWVYTLGDGRVRFIWAQNRAWADKEFHKLIPSLFAGLKGTVTLKLKIEMLSTKPKQKLIPYQGVK